MKQDVREFLLASPFQPFTIVTSGGNRYEVPTRDHAGLSPEGSRVVVWFDHGGSVTLSALHITALEKDSATTASP